MVHPVAHRQTDKGRRVEIIGGVYEGLFGWNHLTANKFADKQWIIVEAGRNAKGKLHEVETARLLKKTNLVFVSNETPRTFEQALLNEHKDINREMRGLAKKLAAFVDFHPRDGKEMMSEFYKMWCEERAALDNSRCVPNARRVLSHPGPDHPRAQPEPVQRQAQTNPSPPRRAQTNPSPPRRAQTNTAPSLASTPQLRHRFHGTPTETQQQLVVYAQETPQEGEGWGFSDTISLISENMSANEVNHNNEIRNTVFSDFLPNYDDLMGNAVSDDEISVQLQNHHNEIEANFRRQRIH